MLIEYGIRSVFLELEASIGHRRGALIILFVAFHELGEERLVKLQRLFAAVVFKYPLFLLNIVILWLL